MQIQMQQCVPSVPIRVGGADDVSIETCGGDVSSDNEKPDSTIVFKAFTPVWKEPSLDDDGSLDNQDKPVLCDEQEAVAPNLYFQEAPVIFQEYRGNPRCQFKRNSTAEYQESPRRKLKSRAKTSVHQSRDLYNPAVAEPNSPFLSLVSSIWDGGDERRINSNNGDRGDGYVAADFSEYGVGTRGGPGAGVGPGVGSGAAGPGLTGGGPDGPSVPIRQMYDGDDSFNAPCITGAQQHYSQPSAYGGEFSGHPRRADNGFDHDDSDHEAFERGVASRPGRPAPALMSLERHETTRSWCSTALKKESSDNNGGSFTACTRNESSAPASLGRKVLQDYPIHPWMVRKGFVQPNYRCPYQYSKTMMGKHGVIHYDHSGNYSKGSVVRMRARFPYLFLFVRLYIVTLHRLYNNVYNNVYITMFI